MVINIIQRLSAPDGDVGLRSCHSLATPPVGGVWEAVDPAAFGGPKQLDATGSVPAESVGFAAFPVVLPNGRVVFGWRGAANENDPAQTTAFMTYTNGGGDYASGGRRWQQAQQINVYGPSNLPLYGPPLWPQTLPGNVRLAADLSVAADPSNGLNPDTNVVMVAYAGRADQNTQNTDIIVARSTTGGAPVGSVPAFPPASTIRITDDLLHMAGVGGPGATAEYRPSLVIDNYHGVNLLICQVALAGQDTGIQNVWYLRWNSFADLAGGVVLPFAARLTPTGYNAWPFFSPTGSPPGVRTGNDYHMMCLAGCDQLLLAYATDESGYWSAYVRAVHLSACPNADVNGDGVVDANDLAAFLSAMSANAPIADRNYDHTVDAQDAILFLSAYHP